MSSTKKVYTNSPADYDWSLLEDTKVQRIIEVVAHRVAIRFPGATEADDLMQDAYLVTASNPKAREAIEAGQFEDFIENVLKGYTRTIYGKQPQSLDHMEDKYDDDDY